MVKRLIQQVAHKITVDYCRLTFVRNSDGFLTNEEVCRLLNQEYQVVVVKGSQLRQRIHFELVYKKNPEKQFVYVCQDTNTLLPDMRREGVILDFSISDLFPLFADKTMIRQQPLEVLERLYDEIGIKKIGLSEGKQLIEKIKSEVEEVRKKSLSHFKERLQTIHVDWTKNEKTIEAISEFIVDAINAGVINDLAQEINDINDQFQHWIDENYFATLQSNPLLSAKCVHKILPHLADNYKQQEKVALLVVDGLTYWQFFILKRHLLREQINANSGSTLSWLPSITKLSRQAIFRGNSPMMDYNQSTENERKLWRDFWHQYGFSSFETQYICDADEFAINEGVKRLAVVTVEMDKKMHSSTDYRDLLSLTENWCQRITIQIKAILGAGYTLYLTTDHGSVLSEGWRNLTSAEKVFLYENESRGRRHLIYKNKDEQRRFISDNSNLALLSRDNWMSIRDYRCFARENERMITHGGSHFMEVVIPFAKIE